MAPDNRIAVCPGSYDPVTNGHLDVISRASAMFDQVIVAVVNLPVRKGRRCSRPRSASSSSSTRPRISGNVEVEPFSILTVDFARARGAKAIVRACARSPTSSTSSR